VQDTEHTSKAKCSGKNSHHYTYLLRFAFVVPLPVSATGMGP
jgi:hypothetical protein